MKAEELENYGKPLSDIMLDPEVVAKGPPRQILAHGT